MRLPHMLRDNCRRSSLLILPQSDNLPKLVASSIFELTEKDAYGISAIIILPPTSLYSLGLSDGLDTLAIISVWNVAYDWADLLGFLSASSLMAFLPPSFLR